ncbi:hypothetical protein D3C87_1976290 [compost metagenome]
MASIIGPQLGIRPGFRPSDVGIRYIFIEMAIFSESEDGSKAEGYAAFSSGREIKLGIFQYRLIGSNACIAR